MQFLKSWPSKQQFFFLFLASFLVRAAVFYFFIIPGNYYNQPDSPDYHVSTLCMAYGHGMYRPDLKEPIFWRTPGYPWFLSKFYQWAGLRGSKFNNYQTAHKASIWFQILLDSFIPILLFYLAWLLTQSLLISCITALIGVFHVGFILASLLILSEAIAIIFFYLFLIFFFKLLLYQPKRWFLFLTLAALTLSAYTWIRPMGEYVALISTLIMFFCLQTPWKVNFKKAALFYGLFFATLLPWYVRNYNYTNEWFFCPTSGPYLLNFCSAKIERDITGATLIDAWKNVQKKAQQHVQIKKKHSPTIVSPLACKEIAMPIIKQRPFLFAYHWLKENIKTTFDLYSYQLVAMHKGISTYDPLEEFLSEKISSCLYKDTIPFTTRAIAWIELLFSLLLWTGIFFGLWRFFLQPLFQKKYNHKIVIWLASGLLIGLCIGLTGGFGYARLRLPIEPLLIILALMYWFDKKTMKRIAT